MGPSAFLEISAPLAPIKQRKFNNGARKDVATVREVVGILYVSQFPFHLQRIVLATIQVRKRL
jgi:hypothetical protein